MAEYIEREAVIAMCVGNAESEWNKYARPLSWADAYEDFAADVEDIPAADVVEVVRCKDCKNWNSGKYGANCEHITSGLFVTPRDGMGFCSYGERRNDA